MARHYVINERDKKLLQEVIDRKQKESLSTVNRPRVDDIPEMSPEVYIAISPPGGIPSMSGLGTSIATMGSAVCSVYQTLNDGIIEPAGGLYFDVYNLSPSAIQGSTIDDPVYVLIAREKFGKWIVIGSTAGGGSEGPGTGTGTGTGGETDDGGGGGTNPCDPITVQETDIRCEDGDLNLYRRTVTMNLHQFTGCLTKLTGDWGFEATIACCDATCAPEALTGTGTVGTGTATSPIGTGSCGFDCYTVDFQSLTLASLHIMNDVLVLADWDTTYHWAGVRFLPGRDIPTTTVVEFEIAGNLYGFDLTIGIRGECESRNPYTDAVTGTLTSVPPWTNGAGYYMLTLADDSGVLRNVSFKPPFAVGGAGKLTMVDDGLNVTLTLRSMPSESLIEEITAESTTNSLALGVQSIVIRENSPYNEIILTQLKAVDDQGTRWLDNFNDDNGTLIQSHLPDIGCPAWYCLEYPPTGTGTGTGTSTTDTPYWYCVEFVSGTGTGTISSRECQQLTAAQLAALVASGDITATYSGPHDTEAACLAECSWDTGTGTGSPSDFEFIADYTLCLPAGVVIDIEVIESGGHGNNGVGGPYARTNGHVTNGECLNITVIGTNTIGGWQIGTKVEEGGALICQAAGLLVGDVFYDGGVQGASGVSAGEGGGGGGGAGGPDAAGGDGGDFSGTTGGAGGTSSFGAGGAGGSNGLPAEDGKFPGGGGGYSPDGLYGNGAGGRVRIWIVG